MHTEAARHSQRHEALLFLSGSAGAVPRRNTSSQPTSSASVASNWGYGRIPSGVRTGRLVPALAAHQPNWTTGRLPASTGTRSHGLTLQGR